jgi:predicted  nucleic acid-binding Zn-ribbon protein
MNDALQAMMTVAQKAKRLYELRSQLRRFPVQLGDARRQMDAERKLLDEVRIPWEATEKALHQKETTVKLALETVEKFEEHMKRVTTQKEYIAARKQVDEARRLNEKLQNEILELRVKQEETLPKLTELRERHGKVAEDYAGQESLILAERGKIEAEIASEEAVLRGEAGKVGANLMPYYERLTKGGKNPAVVPVIAGKCTGCNMALPPQALNQILAKNGTVMTCPNCQRVVFHPPAPAQPAPPAQPATEAGAPAAEPEPEEPAVAAAAG